jgi:hypothetical protein
MRRPNLAGSNFIQTFELNGHGALVFLLTAVARSSSVNLTYTY